MRRLLPTMITVLLSAVAVGQPTDDGRAQLATAAAALDAAQSEQARQRAAHEALAEQIETRKARGHSGLPGVGDGTLDALLKEAHAAAGRLEAVDRTVAAAAARLEVARASRLSALDAALAVENERLATAAPVDRRAAFERMRALVAERAALVAGQLAPPSAKVELPAVAETASVDELRELADEATDSAERVRAQLSSLESRLAALRARRRMLRAAVAFERDTALFAEDERNRRLVRAERPAAVAVGTPTADGRNRPAGGIANDVAEGGAVGDAPGGAPAPPPADHDDGGDRGAEAPQDPSFEAEPPDSDGDGLADVEEPAPPPEVGTVVPSADVGRGAGDGAVVFDTALDPALLTDDLDALTPAAVADQIRAIEARRRHLKQTAADLEERRGGLEDRARALESQ